MHMVYADEAGASIGEEVRLYVGILIDVDTKWRKAESLIAETIANHVPEQYKSGFYFHAVDIYNGGRYREHWSLPDRIAFMKAFLAILRQLEIPIAIGAIREGSQPFKPPEKAPFDNFDLLMSFFFMVNAADRYLRKNSRPDEVAQLICEDLPRKHSIHEKLLEILRIEPYQLPDNASQVPGYLEMHPENRVLHAKHFVDTVYFRKKGEAPLLQLADACAFTLRRFLVRKKYSEDLFEAMTGARSLNDFDHWANPASSTVLFPIKL